MTNHNIYLRSQAQILSNQGYSNTKISELLNVSINFLLKLGKKEKILHEKWEVDVQGN